jgi:hypothetical protein
VPDVQEVESIDAAEPGDRVASFRVVATKEVRAELCRALVREDVALLGLARSERELESVFLELSRTTGQGAAERRAKRKRAAKARAENGGAKAAAAQSVPPAAGGDA